MPALPADNLRNRTFIGMLIAQFLAAFNDQAIHAAAMFFAINQKTLSEAKAIGLMPVLFYAPWALFVTLAGYFADRFSKRKSLIFWKLAEVAIMLVATLGFWLGNQGWHSGPWIVLSCVFLMGMHSAFFVPAKYGAMPEILQPQLLSRGNGILESLSFLAVILGTVAGGLMSDWFDDNDQQYMIGLILLGLAIIGAAASFLIQPFPAANQHRPFPRFIYGPLISSLRTLLKSRPLTLAVVGIAFFTFMVAFMRATVYMLGEAQLEPWSESKTSIIVGTTALGIGFGSPLAGLLSGRKVELGLIPIGAIGMAASCLLAAIFIDHVAGLVACIIATGFFTGFYLVPLFTLLQHRAPKTSKGDAVATSNFINVTGAILASAIFYMLVFAFQQFGLSERIPVRDGVAQGTLSAMEFQQGRFQRIEFFDGTTIPPPELPNAFLEFSRDMPLDINPDDPPEVTVAHYKKHFDHFLVRPTGRPLEEVFDNSHLPRHLFIGAGLMALITLGFLMRLLPDLFARAGWVLRCWRQTRLHVVGTNHLPTDGPVVLATNCHDASAEYSVVSGTDRAIQFLRGPLTDAGLARAERLLSSDVVLALAADAREWLPTLQKRFPATYLPVYYGRTLTPVRVVDAAGPMRVAFGPPLPDHCTLEDAREAIDRAGFMTEEEH